MTEFVANVNGRGDLDYLTAHYRDAEILHVSLSTLRALGAASRGIVDTGRAPWEPPTNSRLWINPSIEGFSLPTHNNDWQNLMGAFEDSGVLAGPKPHLQKDRSTLETFVSEILDDCWSHGPAWITVPQLPHGDPRANRVNPILADVTRDWAQRVEGDPVFVFPVVLTSGSQYIPKPSRAKLAAQSCRWADQSGASSVWVVDTSLADQNGTKNFPGKRFPALLDLHARIGDIRDFDEHMSGPYWALNLVAWARGLATCPVIGLGNGYQYHVDGGITRRGVERIALPSLRRWVRRLQPLQAWLRTASQTLAQANPSASREFHDLATNWAALGANPRDQVSRVYRDWLDLMLAQAPASRAMTLYTDLSSAYVTGKPLHELTAEKTARRPEIVAQQHMLVVL